MKKILLIEAAKIITDQKREETNLSYYLYPNLGLLSIGSVLTVNGYSVTYFSPNLDSENWQEKLKNILVANQFDFVGISNTASTIETDMEIASFVRKILSKTAIITGGYYSWLYPRTILEHTDVDIVVRGEGELPMLEIVKGTKNLKEIPGVCFRYQENNKEKYFIQKLYLMDQQTLNQLPPMDFSFYDYHKL